MTAMNFPASPVNGQQTTDGRYYFDSSVGSTGAWRSTPTPVGGLPAGSIIQWASSTIPTNWLLADGTAVSRTTYASLFAAIGTQYGTGDGSTTFNLPDLRGRIPVGRNGGSFGTLAATGGSETNTLTANNLPAHTHSVNDPGHSHYLGARIGGGSSGWGTVVNAGYTGGADQPYWYSGSAGTGITVGNNTTTNSAVNNLQPYLVVNYIIKATAGWTAGDSELATRVGVLEQNPNISGTLTVAGTTTHNGRVLAPNQPAFSAKRNAGTATNSTVLYQVVDFNTGGHYNSSNGRFTAPVAGKYVFSWGNLSKDTNTVHRYWLYKNGADSNNQLRLDTNATGTEYSSTAVKTQILQLAANDYVHIRYASDNNEESFIDSTGEYSSFNGYLLG